MSTNTDTVADRFAAAGAQIDPLTALTALALAAALGFTLLFLQEPLAHDALHDFRHGAGIICH
ncbi:cobalamin cluster protein [Halorubrum salipaludis]|uniref:Cobalamin cluster protein n=1 Tax=Halorubrum salipaludis TaxID=2032630 RepID=A0A2A2FJF1_9EURY|nr:MULTISPECIES: CbtB domain-containing protein [Halorubrum]PAU84683.1 cobalamin cluster protein [Halorubrum salipaludis]